MPTDQHKGERSMKRTNLFLAFLLITAFAVFALGSSESSTTPPDTAAPSAQTSPVDKTETTPVEQTEAPTEAVKDGYGVGETALQKDVSVTLVGVSESEGSSFNTPADGNVYVLCEFEIENNAKKELNISSMLSFEAYCDDYSCSFSLGALMEKDNKNQLDGTVAPGKKFNGVIGYEVPADWQELEIHFTPDVWFGKSMVFIATND